MTIDMGRALGGGAAALVLASLLAGCGGDSGGPPSLTWYTNPDDGGQAELAKRCTEAAGGRYEITTSVLPNDAAGQREQLVRRLAADDSSIDLISLDPPFVPEFAQAGFLAPVPDDVAKRTTEGVVQGAIDGATWQGEIVAVPFWANTQILWYRKSVAEAAGLDTEKADEWTWDDIIEAAKAQDVQISAQGARAESLTVWLNSLIESAGGHIIAKNSENPKKIELGLDSDAGRRAVEVMRAVARSGQVSAAFSTEDEGASADEFEGDDGGFMVNYGFVWPKVLGEVDAGAVDQSVVDDYGWTTWPRVDADTESAPPLGGIDLGVGAFSKHADFAFEAAECIRSEENQAYYFTTNGNPASLAAVYDDPAVTKAFPMADTIRESLERAAPRPQSAYYSEITGGIQRKFHPPASVDPKTTPGDATDFITAVLAGDQLL